jgi:hypothetical protein
MEKIILLANFVATVYMTGVIWLIQLVQYPLFSNIGNENFSKYHSLHSIWITPVVAPMMLVELITSFALLFYAFDKIDYRLIWLGLILTLITWSSTFFLQVPMHEKLSAGFDKSAHDFLVYSNWLRTLAWTLRGILVSYFIWQSLK